MIMVCPPTLVKRGMFVLVLVLSGLMMSCAPWRDSYFDGGIDELTQAEVRETLGKPHIVEDPLLSDETTWIYRQILSESELDPWGFTSFGKEAESVLVGPEGVLREIVYCYVYTLTFDKEDVLRHWKRDLCQVPTPANPFEQDFSDGLQF